MSVRRLVAGLGAAAVAVVVPAVPAAAATTDLYVASADQGGSDAGDCSQASPCATVARAVEVADPSGTTIHVGAGTFSGNVDPDGKDLQVVGDPVGGTTLTNTFDPDQVDTWSVVSVGSGAVSLSYLTVSGAAAADVEVYGTGSLVADHVVVDGGGCSLGVLAGDVLITDSTLQNGGHNSGTCSASPSDPPLSGDVAMSGGTVALVRTQVLDPDVGASAVAVYGGSFTADQSLLDDRAHDPDTNGSNGVYVLSGTVTVTRSAFRGFAQGGFRADGGTNLLSDDTFVGNVVGVSGDLGSTTVVRSTFRDELASLQGIAVSVAASLLGPDSIRNCNGTITDLGYNLSTDDTCGFTAATSREDVADLGLGTTLADHGGPVPTVATTWPSPAVDAIPVGATYGPSKTPLCPTAGTTDLRGVPRPQAGACDAGSTELVRTTTSLHVPATARPQHAVTLQAAVDVPDVGVAGIEAADGTVTFRSGSTLLCKDVALVSGAAACTTSALVAGSRAVRASFTPAAGSTLHPSTSPTGTILVGTRPSFHSPHRTTFVVGRSGSFTVRAWGSPHPRITVVAGRLPAGLHLHARAGRAGLTGTARASAVGTHRVTLEAGNLRGSVRQVLTVVVSRH